jgi:hypothetical protein
MENIHDIIMNEIDKINDEIELITENNKANVSLMFLNGRRFELQELLKIIERSE